MMKQLSNISPSVSLLAASIEPGTHRVGVQRATTRLSVHLASFDLGNEIVIKLIFKIESSIAEPIISKIEPQIPHFN